MITQNVIAKEININYNIVNYLNYYDNTYWLIIYINNLV